MREDGTISGTAFRLRPGETYLSVNWLEHLGLQDRLAVVGEVWRVLSTKRNIGATAKLAVLNVGIARASVVQYSHDLRDLAFRHEPELEQGMPPDPSHSDIQGLLEDDNLIAELLAKAVAEVHRSRQGEV